MTKTQSRWLTLVIAVAAALLLWSLSGSGDRSADVGVSQTNVPAAAMPIEAVASLALPPQPSAFNTDHLERDPVKLVDAEVANSAAAEAPASYVGVDGKRRSFRYGARPLGPAELGREARRQRLMTEVVADPEAFARTHDLNPKEARWIADGEAELPERLLQ